MPNMANKQNQTFTNRMEASAFRALEDSENLLQQVKIAEAHIERVFRVQIEAHAEPGNVPEEDTMALELIRTRLQGLRTTIQMNQFFPRAYFSERFHAESAVDIENTETWITLRNFVKKYTPTTEESWAYHTAFEVVTFQSYDAPDFRQYLAVKSNGHGRVEVDSAPSSTKSAMVSSGATPNGLKNSLDSVNSSKGKSVKTVQTPVATTVGTPVETPVKMSAEKRKEEPNFISQKSIHSNPCNSPCIEIGRTSEDSKSSKSSNLKSKVKTMFSFGLKKKSGGKQNPSKTATNSKMSERTEAVLAKHNHIVPGGKR